MTNPRSFPSLLCGAAVLALLAGCASTDISDRNEYQGGPLPRPGRIIVHDFAATSSDLPSWSKTQGLPSAPMSEEDLAAGRKLGAEVARELVEKINADGLTAVRAAGQSTPDLNDIVLIGYFTSVDTGSATERVLIGFGKGAAQVNAHAEGYHMTDQGLELLGSGTVDSGGGKGPGLVVPTIVTIATANPIGLVVSGAVKAEGEISGRTTETGAAKRIADTIAKQLEIQFRKQGWL